MAAWFTQIVGVAQPTPAGRHAQGSYLEEGHPMLRTPLAALTLAAACLMTISQAGAQGYSGVSYSGWYLAPAYGQYGAWSSGTPILPYSYYAAYPYPARIYVGYGAYDFPFYGQPYGYPYDKWTWPYMTSGYGGLARYYYPPVP
jgi:hypothetical protein